MHKKTNRINILKKGIYQLLLLAAKGISFLAFLILRFLLRYRFKVIQKNLKNAFPAKNDREIRKLVNAYYVHMSDLLIEPFLFYLVTPYSRARLATYTNTDLLHQLYRDRKQVVLFASHYGNWEYLIDLPQVADYQVYTAYSPVNNQLINRALLKIRSFLGVTLIPKQQFYRKALSLLRQPGLPKLIVLIADQRPAPGNFKYHLPFLHQDTVVQTGGERMAISADTAVVYIESNKTGRFRYNYTFRLMYEKASLMAPMDIITEYYRNLEQTISKAPVYWLWSHNRWKFS